MPINLEHFSNAYAAMTVSPEGMIAMKSPPFELALHSEQLLQLMELML